MQVSKLLVLFSLVLLAVVLYIATPAIALEHPWEEGESQGGVTSEGPGTTGPFPDNDTIQTPFLRTSTQGSFFWWFELILNPRIDSSPAQSSSLATPADTRKTDSVHRNQTIGSMN